MKNWRIYQCIAITSAILHAGQLGAETITNWLRGTKNNTFKKEIVITPKTHILVSQENSGTITVVPSEKANTITIEEEQYGKAERVNAPRIITRNQNNTLLITAPKEEVAITITLSVPAKTPLSITSANGNIIVEDIQAPLVLEAQYGSIYVKNATQSISATANRGTIDIDYEHVQPETTAALAATSHITLALPKGTTGEITASTQGKIVSEHYITLAPITTKITPRTWKELLHSISGQLNAPITQKSRNSTNDKDPNKFILESTQKGKIAIRER